MLISETNLQKFIHQEIGKRYGKKLNESTQGAANKLYKLLDIDPATATEDDFFDAWDNWIQTQYKPPEDDEGQANPPSWDLLSNKDVIANIKAIPGSLKGPTNYDIMSWLIEKHGMHRAGSKVGGVKQGKPGEKLEIKATGIKVTLTFNDAGLLWGGIGGEKELKEDNSIDKLANAIDEELDDTWVHAWQVKSAFSAVRKVEGYYVWDYTDERLWPAVGYIANWIALEHGGVDEKVSDAVESIGTSTWNGTEIKIKNKLVKIFQTYEEKGFFQKSMDFYKKLKSRAKGLFAAEGEKETATHTNVEGVQISPLRKVIREEIAKLRRGRVINEAPLRGRLPLPGITGRIEQALTPDPTQPQPPTPAPVDPDTARTKNKFKEGDKVTAVWTYDKRWWPGVITDVPSVMASSEVYTVKWDNPAKGVADSQPNTPVGKIKLRGAQEKKDTDPQRRRSGPRYKLWTDWTKSGPMKKNLYNKKDGSLIKKLQGKVFSDVEDEMDGYFGPKTETAVGAYITKHKIEDPNKSWDKKEVDKDLYEKIIAGAQEEKKSKDDPDAEAKAACKEKGVGWKWDDKKKKCVVPSTKGADRTQKFKGGHTLWTVNNLTGEYDTAVRFVDGAKGPQASSMGTLLRPEKMEKLQVNMVGNRDPNMLRKAAMKGYEALKKEMEKSADYIEVNDGEKYTHDTLKKSVYNWLFTAQTGHKGISGSDDDKKPKKALKGPGGSNVPWDLLKHPSLASKVDKTEPVAESAFNTFLDLIDSNTLKERDLDIFLESFNNDD